MRQKHARETFQWMTVDGRLLPLPTISDVHLANIINHVRSRGEYGKGVLALLLKEANLRNLSKEFLASAPIPWQDVDGKWKRLKGNKYEVIGR